MEEGYLALRWNNHNTIFTKILNLLREQEAYTDVSLACGGRLYAAHKFVLSTCSDYFKEMFSKTPCKHPVVFMKDVAGKDLEFLLDFMYKGEVHVPQSDLGSLLRTAEGLQVKGLAVPDDASRPTMSAPYTSVPCAAAPSPAPSCPSTLGITRSQGTLNTHSLQMKRKRISESNKKEDPPKLPPASVDVTKSHCGNRNSKSRRSLTLPELKRIKLDEKSVRNNNTHCHDSNRSTPHIDTSDIASESPPPPPAQSRQRHHEELGSSLKQTIKVEEVEFSRNCKENHAPGEDENDRASVDDEREREEDFEGEDKVADENSIPPSDADENFEQSNSSLPNSELSTAELLQVDLSEDGTQFIIGPGGFGRASRASSAAGEEETSEGNKKPFICLLCGHTFTRRDNLANHLKTHTGDRPFMCQYCHKCFSRKDYLKQHERIHTGEKPYACEICGRAFTRKEGLTDHMRCHSDYKAFACETCGKSFKQKCGLRFHKRNYRH